MGRRPRNQTELVAFAGQMSLFNDKLFEHSFVARARFNVIGSWTRNIIKTLVADIQEGDTEFRRLFIPREQLWGGIDRRNDRNNQKLTEEECVNMSKSNMIVRKIDNPKSFKVYNFFDGLIEYDDKHKGVWARLNPYLAPYFFDLIPPFSVLQRQIYFDLSVSFQKDLYEWLIGHQNNSPINHFTISVEKFCEHFRLKEYYLKQRAVLWRTVNRAVTKINETMQKHGEDYTFTIWPKTATAKEHAKASGKLLGFDIYLPKAHGFARQADIPQYKQTAYLAEKNKKKQAAEQAANAAKKEESYFSQQDDDFNVLLSSGYYDDLH